ncbi:hypothetical protein ACP70R_012849 [Stipagrostis hirtigluma subsp. patula]
MNTRARPAGGLGGKRTDFGRRALQLRVEARRHRHRHERRRRWAEETRERSFLCTLRSMKNTTLSPLAKFQASLSFVL